MKHQSVIKKDDYVRPSRRIIGVQEIKLYLRASALRTPLRRISANN